MSNFAKLFIIPRALIILVLYLHLEKTVELTHRFQIQKLHDLRGCLEANAASEFSACLCGTVLSPFLRGLPNFSVATRNLDEESARRGLPNFSV